MRERPFEAEAWQLAERVSPLFSDYAGNGDYERAVEILREALAGTRKDTRIRPQPEND